MIMKYKGREIYICLEEDMFNDALTHILSNAWRLVL